MQNRMMHPPASALQNTITLSGRVYTSTPGTPLLMPDGDADEAGANGWMRAGEHAGTTALRPLTPHAGERYDDSTVGYTIMFDGVTWRNAVTGASV